jgi:FKBP-type peptidyl-prolyl cis-trans isomerase
VRQGEGAPAKKGAQIQAHYDGKLTDGKGFDSSRKRGQPFKFGLGGGQVIKGWDLGFNGMQVGEKAVLEISSQYVSGARVRERPPCQRALRTPHQCLPYPHDSTPLAQGYGASGAGGVIPGGATLYFEVELMGFSGGEL